ncbi:MAG: TGS domain-containing protein [Planctomycetes bacterium]|nr:TGS domain-containing protein [Planctomycetota bacterium]
MPANLTPQYLKAEEQYKAAKTTGEKIAALENMIALLPKHKGTEHLQADLRRRLSKLKDESERESRSKKGGFDPFRIPKQGAGQIILLGPPNAGKSALVGRLTKAHVVETPFPFATTVPVPGMVAFEDVQIQLVDLPSVQMGLFPPGLLGLIKSTDAVCLLADLSAPEVLDEVEALFKALEEGKVRIFDRARPPPPDLFLKDQPAMVLANKIDAGGAEEALALLAELLVERFVPMPISAVRGDGLAELPRKFFELLDRIRVYSKEPGKPPDLSSPFTLARGETVLDLAGRIHRDFPDHLRQARLWGSARFEGQAVPKEYVLKDKDVVELSIDLSERQG